VFNLRDLNVLYLTMGAGIGGGSISLQTLIEELRKFEVSCSVVLPENGPLVDRYERIDGYRERSTANMKGQVHDFLFHGGRRAKALLERL
jgi:hypothetical protein